MQSLNPILPEMSAGHDHVREAAITTHVAGFRLTKTFEYSTRDSD